MDRRAIIRYFANTLKFDISFIKEKYLERAFCVNFYELKKQEGTDNMQLATNENKGNMPLALVGEKAFHLIKFSEMYSASFPVEHFLGDHKKDDDQLAAKLCDKLELFQFAYIQVNDEIKDEFEGNNGLQKKSQLFFALIGAMYMSIEENNQCLIEIKRFINKFVHK